MVSALPCMLEKLLLKNIVNVGELVLKVVVIHNRGSYWCMLILNLTGAPTVVVTKSYLHYQTIIQP